MGILYLSILKKIILVLQRHKIKLVFFISFILCFLGIITYRLRDNSSIVKIWLKETDGSYREESNIFVHYSPIFLHDFLNQVFGKRITEIYNIQSKVDDISVLEGLKELKYLDLSDTNIRNIRPLKNLILLEDLILTGTNVNDISSISSLIHLKNLDLSDTKISEINSLTKLVNITTLNLSKTYIRDCTSLRNFKNLETLNVLNLTIKNFGFLSNLKSIKHLNLSGTKILNLKEPLSVNKSLIDLNISYTNIQDISILENFPKLRFLDISGNDIKNSIELKKFKHLEKLIVINTSLDIGIDELKKALPNCDFVLQDIYNNKEILDLLNDIK